MARSQIHSRGLEAVVDNGGSSIASRRDHDDDDCGFRGGIFANAGDAKDEIRLWDDGTFHGDGDGNGVDNHNDQDDNHNNNIDHDSERGQRHQSLSVITSQNEDAHLSSLLLSAYPSSPLSGNRRRHNRTTPHHSSLRDLDTPPSAPPPAAAAMGTSSTRSRSSRESTSCSRSPLKRHRSHPHRPPPSSLFERSDPRFRHHHDDASDSTSTPRSLSPLRRPHHAHHGPSQPSPPHLHPRSHPHLRLHSLLSSFQRLVSRSPLFRRHSRDAAAPSPFQFPLPPRPPRFSFSNKTHWCLAWLFAVTVHACWWHRPRDGGMDWPKEEVERRSGSGWEEREERGASRGTDRRREVAAAVSGNGTVGIGTDGSNRWRGTEGRRERFDGLYSAQRGGISEWSLESSWRASGASGNETVDFHIDGASKYSPRSISFEGTRNGGSDVHSLELLEWISSRRDSAEEPSEDEAGLKSSTVVWEKGRDCVPMADWQDTFHPTCNSIHEMDVSLMLSERSFSLVSSKGFWRNAWKVNVTRTEDYPMTQSTWQSNHEHSVADRYAVLKSLKYVHDPNDETFELSRVDAVALDVVTQSRFTINIYGYCATSSLQEFANGDLKGLLPRLEPLEKLRYAAWVAQGVADVHGVGAERETEPRSGETERVVPFIHNDLNMDNILLGSRDGVEFPLLNDFNIAVFRKKDAATGEPCKFRGRFANPQWMSPEQQERPEDELSTKYLNEKVDIYALGNILYKIAVGNSPWKNDYKTVKITPELKAKIARAKLRGGKPKVPADVRNTTDPSTLAILNAMDWCYRNDPELRPSAREIAYNLKAELEALERNGTADVQWPRLRSRRLI